MASQREARLHGLLEDETALRENLHHDCKIGRPKHWMCDGPQKPRSTEFEGSHLPFLELFGGRRHVQGVALDHFRLEREVWQAVSAQLGEDEIGDLALLCAIPQIPCEKHCRVLAGQRLRLPECLWSTMQLA
eukprot:4455837-Amphidinium_carterae.1